MQVNSSGCLGSTWTSNDRADRSAPAAPGRRPGHPPRGGPPCATRSGAAPPRSRACPHRLREVAGRRSRSPSVVPFPCRVGPEQRSSRAEYAHTPGGACGAGALRIPWGCEKGSGGPAGAPPSPRLGPDLTGRTHRIPARILVGMETPSASPRPHHPSSPFQRHPEPVIERFVVGDRVSHDSYGLGRVVGVDGGGATVDFSSRTVRIATPFRKMTKL